MCWRMLRYLIIHRFYFLFLFQSIQHTCWWIKLIQEKHTFQNDINQYLLLDRNQIESMYYVFAIVCWYQQSVSIFCFVSCSAKKYFRQFAFGVVWYKSSDMNRFVINVFVEIIVCKSFCLFDNIRWVLLKRVVVFFRDRNTVVCETTTRRLCIGY